MSHSFKEFLSKNEISAPVLHVVLGSGFADVVPLLKIQLQQNNVKELNFSDITDCPVPKNSAHEGKYFFFRNLKKEVICIQSGRVHLFEGYKAREIVKPVSFTSDLGTKNYLLISNVGSLDLEKKPGSIVLIEDHINLTGVNPLIPETTEHVHTANLDENFLDMSTAWDIGRSRKVMKIASKKFDTYSGVYAGVLGPNFETPAEVKMIKALGANVVGMSTVNENIALRKSGASVVGMCFVSAYAAGVSKAKLDSDKILLESKTAAKKLASTLATLINE